MVQLIGHSLVSLYNRQVFEESISRSARIISDDLEQVLHNDDLFYGGHSYFFGLWQQLENEEAIYHPLLRTVAQISAQDSLAVEMSVIASVLALDPDEVTRYCRLLEQRDVLIIAGNQVQFAVELMRQWVLEFGQETEF